MLPKTTQVQPLWCKEPGKQLLYHSEYLSALDGYISFRSFRLETDLSMVHQWNNLDYSRDFWQMRGSAGLLRSCYQCILQNPFAHSFIGLFNREPVCQFDIYKIA